jgi:hypothetical protein
MGSNKNRSHLINRWFLILSQCLLTFQAAKGIYEIASRKTLSPKLPPPSSQEEEPKLESDLKKAEASKETVPEQATPKEERDLRREEYDRHIDLFKFYCEIALKGNLYFYLITGGITSFYFNTTIRNNFIEVSFMLPIFMSGVMGGIFIYGRHLWFEVVESIDVIREDLTKRGLVIKKTPEVSLLASLLLIFGWLFFVVGGALTVLMAVQMKNSGVWAAYNTWLGEGGLLRTGRPYFILLPAVLILLSGFLLPYRAFWINWKIKRGRKWFRRRFVKNRLAELEDLESVDSFTFKDSLLYYRLRPHLSETTLDSIRVGTLEKHHLSRDLEELEIAWELKPPKPEPVSDERQG